MRRARVKICGITRVEDALLAAELGADALGMVFYAGSSRVVNLQQARAVRERLPAFVSLIGLFVDPDEAEVRAVIEAVHLDGLQFHGDESEEFCLRFDLPYIKAVRVRPDVDPLQQVAEHPQAAAILLDAWDPRLMGGTGRAFDWTVARKVVADSHLPVVLAGGLQADNAARAVQEVAPWALDLSSGVESEPGVKDPAKLKAFFDEVACVRF